MSFRLARRKLRPLEWIQKCWMHFYCFTRKINNEMNWNFHRLVLLHISWLLLSMESFTDTLPIVCNGFKTQHGGIPIDPAILAAIGRRFVAKNSKCQRADLRRRARRPQAGVLFVCVNCINTVFRILMLNLLGIKLMVIWIFPGNIFVWGAFTKFM